MRLTTCPVVPALSLLAGLAFASSAQAQFTWTNTASASAAWGTASNWSGNSVPGVGVTVDLSANLSANQTITLGADRTVNGLSAGDPTGPLFTTTLTGNTLIFQGLFGSATYDQNESAGAVTFASAVTLASDLRTNIRAGSQTTFSGAVGGTGELIVDGAGTLVLSGANTYSGGTTISAGTLRIGDGGTSGSVSGNIVNNAALAFNRSDAVTVANVVSGSGSLTQAGAGTLTLTGNNSYSGGTTLAAGTLALGSANALGSTGTLSFTGGTLQFSAANTTDYSSRFSSAANQSYRLDTNGQTVTLASALTSSGGSLTKLGSGTLTLLGNNSYSGTTTVSAGTLQVGNGGTAGSLGSGTVSNGASLVFNRSDDFTVASRIEGSGTVAKLGAGTLALTANNTLSGTTTISAGTLQIGNGGTTGALGSGDIVNHAALVFNRSDSIAGVNAHTVPNAISGTGTLLQAGTGTVTFSGNNSFTGGTTLSAGTLVLGSTGALGSTGTISFGGGTLRYSSANTGDYSARFSAAANQSYRLDTNGQSVTLASALTSSGGSLVKLGTGTLTLSANNTYSGGTTVSAGTLQLGNGGSLGSGAVVNNATLALNRSDHPTVANAISGTGALTKLGTGSVTLSGNNTYTGNTTVTAGTLRAGATGVFSSLSRHTIDAGSTLDLDNYDQTLGGLSGSGSIVLGSAGLSVIQSSSGSTYSGAISGSGSLTKLGNSLLTLTGSNSYSGNTTVSAGILELGDGGTSGSLGSGNLTINSLFWVNRSDALTLAGDISGSGTLQQRGSGTLTLTGNNSFRNLNLAAGTLTLGSAGALGSRFLGSSSGQITFNGGTLQYTSANNLDYSNRFSRADNQTLRLDTNGQNVSLSYDLVSSGGSLIKLGAGTLSIWGTSAYTGGTTISAGTLQIGTAFSGTLGTGGVTNHGTLAFNRWDGVTLAEVVSGSGTLEQRGSGTLTLTADNTYTGTTTVSAGTLEIGAGGTSGTLGTGSVTVASGATLAVNRSDAVTVANAISGLGTLTKIGAETLTLTGSNSYYGNTTVSAGTLRAGSTGAFSANSVHNLAAGATLDFNGFNPTIGGLAGAGAVSLGSVALSVNQNAYTTFSGSISGSGSLAMLAGGTLTLSGNNTFTGGITLSAGIVALGSSGALGSTGPISFGGGTLRFSAANTTDYSPRFSNAANQVYRLDTNGQNVTAASNLTSAGGSLVKLGTGTLTLSGNNAYTGGTTVSAGTLQIGNNGGTTPLGSGEVVNRANLTFNRSSNLTFANPISGSGSVSQIGSSVLTLTGNNSYTGTTTISGTLQIGAGGTSGTLGTGAVVNNGTLRFNRSDTIAVANAISGSGTLHNLGTGTLTFTGNNTYSGSTFVTAGTLQIGNGGTTGNLGSGEVPLTATLAFNRSDNITVANFIYGQGSLAQLGTGTLTLTGDNSFNTGTTFTLAAGTLALGSAGALGEFGTIVFNGGTLKSSAANTTDYSARFSSAANQAYRFDTAGQNITLASALTSSGGSLVKLGAGTLTLSAANTYSGATTIAAGTLKVANSSGSVFGSGAVTVAAGATLTGAGAFTGSLQLLGTIAPGNSPGTLATGAQTWGNGSAYVWEINQAAGTAGTNYDLLSISGTLTLAATAGNPFTLRLVSLLPDNSAGQVINFNAAQNSTYTLATTTGGILGFDTFGYQIETSAFANSLAGGTWSLALANGNRDLALHFTAASAIPEPSTYAALAGLAALALAAWRRRRTRP